LLQKAGEDTPSIRAYFINPFAYGRALFHEVARCSDVFDGANALLDHIRASGQSYSIDGYLIHSHRYLASESTTVFWTLQASIVENLFNLRRLRIFVAFVHPDHDGRSVSKFVRQLHIGGWVITRTDALFPDFGDSVVGTVSVIIGIHTSTQSKVDPLLFQTPPTRRPLTLASFIWPAFNKPEYKLSLAVSDDSFVNDDTSDTIASMPTPSVVASLPAGITVLYHLHTRSTGPGSLNGSAVLSLDSLCAPFDGAPNANLFGHHFGIEFHYDDHTYVRAILPFEFTSCFGLTDDLRYWLSKPDNWFALDAGIPVNTSAWVFDHVLDRLCAIRDSNSEIFEPNQFAASAAHIQAFVNGTVGI
jgi:hypothetical protein